MSEKTSASVLMVLWLMAMKLSLKKKNRSQRYDTNWPRSRYRPKYTKYKMYPSIMVICIKQHLRNNWSSIHEKVNMPSRAGRADRASALPQSLLTMCSFFFLKSLYMSPYLPTYLPACLPACLSISCLFFKYFKISGKTYYHGNDITNTTSPDFFRSGKLKM